MTRRRRWRGRRVVWTPLCGPPLLAKRALQLATEQALTGKVQKFKMREASIAELGLEAAERTETA